MDQDISKENNFQDFERNEEQTLEIQKDQKFIKFVNWCKQEGVFQEDDIEFPVVFGNGVVGVAAKKNIPANKLVAAIPQKMIITRDSIRKSDLKDIILENPDLFDEKVYPSNEFNCFALFLIMERLKGEKSYFYPYLQIIQESTTLLEWNEKELEHTNDDYIKQESQSCNNDIQLQLSKLHSCMLKYQNVFPRDLVDIKMVYWAYQSVMTRIFGWCLPNSFMIPFADMFNHSDQKPINHNLVNLRLEELESKEKGYKVLKNKIDFGILKNTKLNIKDTSKLVYKNKIVNYIMRHKNQLSVELIKDLEQINTETLQTLQKPQLRKLLYNINQNRFKSKSKKDNPEKKIQFNMWDLKYFTTTDCEDNDTDEEIYEERRYAVKKMKEREIQQLKSTKTMQQKKKVKENEIQQKMNKKIFLEDQTGDSDYTDDEDNNNSKNSSSGSSEEESEESSSEEEDSEWEWYDDEDTDVYIILSTDYPYKQGEQIHNCYGSRTNKFLMQWYGFCLLDNKYDSYMLRLNMDLLDPKLSDQLVKNIIFRQYVEKIDIIRGYVEYGDQKVFLNSISKDFKLKKGIINMDFIIYLRIFLMTHYNGPDLAYVVATLPISLIFEDFVLKFGLHILYHLRKQYQTSIEQDLYMLKFGKIEEKLRFAVVYRIGQKSLLDAQIKMFQNTIDILKDMRNSESLKKSYMNIMDNDNSNKNINSIKDIHHLKPYLETLFYSIKRGFVKSSHLLLKEREQQKEQNNQNQQQQQSLEIKGRQNIQKISNNTEK